MAIDQRDVSSTLRFMDDRALQQYAAMHKNDPYIFPLAFQESQNRQKIRMSQQTAQGVQPQPKVADQALAQMAPQPMPEDRGIATLAAPNMQQMADGGIAGYPDDDFVTRDQSVVMMAEGGVARYNGTQGSVTNSMPQFVQDIMGIPQMYTDYQQRIREEDERKAESDRRMAQAKKERLEARQKTSFANYLFGSPEREAEGKAQLAELSAPTPGQQQAEFIRQQDKLMEKRVPRRQGDEFEAEEASIAARAAKPPVADPSAKAGPKADTKRKDTERKDPSANRPAAAPSNQFDVAAMMKTALEDAEKKVDPLETRQKAINAAKEKQAQEYVTGLEAIHKQFSDIYKGKKERLDTREGEIGKMKDQSLGLALLNAGARMMQTRGSIGEAIGAGIDTGSKQYVAGLDKINSAKEKLSDARDRLDELEAQRGELSARELHKARNEVKSITTAGMEDLVKAAMAERKMNRTEAIAFVTAQLNANLKLYEVDQRSKDTRALIAARGDTSGVKADRLKLDGLKTLATTLTNEIKNDPFLSLPRNSQQKKVKEAELARVKDQIAQMTGLGTMMPASPAGAGSGVQFLGYE
jgi:hypothetical protein